MIIDVIAKMELLNMLLNAVKTKFPKQSSRIETLYAADKDFRTLCSDYFSCVQYLQKLASNVSEGQSTIKEYEDIKRELEKDLYAFIYTS